MGYAGGRSADPTYHNLGDHAETVQIEYDPSILTYDDLLSVFFSSHRPTVPSYSPQYRSVIFYHDEEQRRLAQDAKERLERKAKGQIYTDIEAFTGFTLAEDYHQKYGLRHNAAVMREFEAAYPDPMDFINSTAAARVNGYLYGNGSLLQLKEELPELGLSESSARVLESFVGKYSR